jgi:hypothetical protein
MATLMALYNSEGCVGRCDATCYNAKHKRCTCICGGRNHGVGKALAEQQVREGAALQPPDADFLKRRSDLHALGDRTTDLVMIDRLRYPNNRRARTEAHMRINQYELLPHPEAG